MGALGRGLRTGTARLLDLCLGSRPPRTVLCRRSRLAFLGLGAQQAKGAASRCCGPGALSLLHLGLLRGLRGSLGVWLSGRAILARSSAPVSSSSSPGLVLGMCDGVCGCVCDCVCNCVWLCECVIIVCNGLCVNCVWLCVYGYMSVSCACVMTVWTLCVAVCVLSSLSMVRVFCISPSVSVPVSQNL